MELGLDMDSYWTVVLYVPIRGLGYDLAIVAPYF